MKILVALKQVPAGDSHLKLAPDARWIDESDLTFETNEPDAYALEEALQLKEKHGGEVVVLCAGPARSTSSIMGALAKGADRAIHIEEPNLGAYDTLGLARLLAAAAAPEQADLILTGLQTDDLGQGQTGVVMAELLGLPHAAIVIEVEFRDGALYVKRELEDGWFQHVTLPTPALLTVQSGISRLRYATLMGIKNAKTKEIRRLTAAALGAAPAPSAALVRMAAPPHVKRTQIITGSPREAAAALVERLKFEVRVL
jgi:electron transfer flavoprotein beta subunit